MTINIRAKGQVGEREVADMLNFIIYKVMQSKGYAETECLKAMQTVQRNQNQSAVGGNDLTNCFGLSIEVKRQETLSIPTWWKQCVASAARNNEVPVLIYRQNRKPWRVVTYADLPFGDGTHLARVVADFDIETFKAWFSHWVSLKLDTGHEIRM